MKRISHKTWTPSGVNYKPENMGLTNDEMTFVKAYMNANHDNNFANCRGVPAGTGLRSYICNVKLSAEGIKPDSAGKICLVATGLPEIPLIQYDGPAKKIKCWRWPGGFLNDSLISDPSNQTSGTSDWMKIHGVGAYRQCCGSIKVEDLTAPVYATGSISAARNCAGYDLGSVMIPPAQPNFQTTGTETSLNVRTRVYDSISLSAADNESLSTKAYVGKSVDGLYAIQTFLDAEGDFVDRKDATTKALISVSKSPTSINAVAYLQTAHCIKEAGSNDVYLINETSKGNFNTTSISYASLYGSGVSAPTMTSINVVGSGLDVTNTTWRVTMCGSFEFIPSAGSDLTSQCKDPMPPNVKVIQAVATAVGTMPDGYPASANFFNELWDKFKSVYKSLEPVVKTVVGKLPPQYQTMASQVKDVIDDITDIKKDIKDNAKEVKQEIKQLVQTQPLSMPTAPTTRHGRR